MSKVKKVRLYKSEGTLGFNYNGFFITDPSLSECGRFEMNPTKDYGLTKEQVKQLEKEVR